VDFFQGLVAHLLEEGEEETAQLWENGRVVGETMMGVTPDRLLGAGTQKTHQRTSTQTIGIVYTSFWGTSQA